MRQPGPPGDGRRLVGPGLGLDCADIWLTSRAFDLTFSFLGSFLVVGYLTVGVALPTPGGAGGSTRSICWR